MAALSASRAAQTLAPAQKSSAAAPGAPKARAPAVHVKPHKWEWTKEKGYAGRFEVRAWGLTPESEPVCVRFLYEMPLVLALDPDYSWDHAAADRVVRRLCEVVKGPKPVSWEFLPEARPLYSAYLREGKAVRLRYNSWAGYDAMRWALAEGKLKNGTVKNADGFEVWPGTKMRLGVRNEKVTPDIALLTEKGMDTTGWFHFTGSVVRNERVSRLDLEYVVEPSSVQPTPADVCKGWDPKLKILVIDAEANAERSTAMPKANNLADAAFCIGCLLRHRDGTEEMHAFCSVKRPAEPNGVRVHFYEEEEDAIIAYSNFIRDSMPDVIGTHNGMGWDEEYLWQRLARVIGKWPNDSRLLQHDSVLLKKEWESSAYAGMRFYWVERPGVMHCDLLPWSKRALNRLDSYKLDYLDRKFGGTGKLLGDEDKAKVDLDDVGGPEEKEEQEDYLEAHKIFEYYNRGDPEELKSILIYCVGFIDENGEKVKGDCGITLRLMDKLQMWISLTQMAKVAFVQPFDVFTRGMQYRTYNQVAREAHKRGMYMLKEAPEKIPVKGAHVFPPMRGLWNLVFTFDFKGLYPSIIRRYNLCWTTYVPGKGEPNYDPGFDDPASPKYVSDERCNVFSWTERWHTDEYEEWKQGKKKSAKKKYKGDIMLIEHRHRFLKEPRGILPSNLDRAASDRAAATKERNAYAKNTFEYDMKDKEQDAIKLNMNSAYGGLASDLGPLSLHPAGAVVTYMARCSAQKMAKYYEDTYQAKVVYGDSVTPDTPILCRVLRADGTASVAYRAIEELGGGAWVASGHGEGKEECAPLAGLQVWTDEGFTPVRRVIRHACGKPLKRVCTRSGVVDVTTDHSLLSPAGERLRPTEVVVGQALMHADLPREAGDRRSLALAVFCVTADKLGAARSFYDGERGGHAMAVSVANGRYIVCSLDTGETGARDAVVSVEDLPPYAGLVYDLETANHHFAAGVGRMVVHNTDSAFVWYPADVVERERVREDPWAWGVRMAKEGTALFEKPMELEFEKVFEWLFLANKKQYVGPIIPKPDPVTNAYKPTSWKLEDMISRGLMFVKRGAAPVMQEMQKQLVLMALMEAKNGTPLRERQEMAMTALEAFSYRLMSGRVPEKELIITQKIGQEYKQAGNFLNVFRMHLVAKGKVVNPGDRMPYLLIKVPGAKKQGEKMELPEFRRDTHARIDYLYYLEKRGVKPYDTVLEHGFSLTKYMHWHVRYLKKREKLQAELRKRFGEMVELKGERDTLRMDRAARHQRRQAGPAVPMSLGVRRWYRCLLRKKEGFGARAGEAGGGESYLWISPAGLNVEVDACTAKYTHPLVAKAVLASLDDCAPPAVTLALAARVRMES